MTRSDRRTTLRPRPHGARRGRCCPPAARSPPPEQAVAEHVSTFGRFCTDCHNDAEAAGELSLEGVTAADVAASTEIFERVVRKLRSGLMPPPGEPRPETAEAQALLVALERYLDETAAARGPEPGRVALHRLNRTEAPSTTSTGKTRPMRRAWRPRCRRGRSTRRIRSRSSLEIGDEEIEYGHLPEAHTDGDIYVWFKKRNVLAAGGAVTFGAYPVIDYATGGWIGGLVDATKKLLALTNADTLIVPANGPAQPRSHLTAQLEMLTVVRERIENLMRDGRSIAEMLDAGVTEGVRRQVGRQPRALRREHLSRALVGREAQ